MARERLRPILPAALAFFTFFMIGGVAADGYDDLGSQLWYNALGNPVELVEALAISSQLDRYRARRSRDCWVRAVGLAALAAFIFEPVAWAISKLPVITVSVHPRLIHLDSLISGFLIFLLWVLAHMTIRSGDRAAVQERRIAAAREGMIRSETEALLLSLDPTVLLDALRRIGERLSGGAAKTAAETVIALAEHMRGTLSSGRSPGPEDRAPDVPGDGREDLAFDEARVRRRFRAWTLIVFVGLEAAVLALAAGSSRRLVDYYLHLTPQPLLGAAWCMIMEAVLARPGRRSLRRAHIEAAALCGLGVVLSVLLLLAVTVAMDALRRPYFLSGILAIELFYAAPVFVAWSATWFILDARRREIARLRAAAEIRQAALTARNAMLRQQINPHFLFNALNALYALILDGEQARALGVIDAIRRFVERAGAHGGDFVPLSAELATQDAYLDIERVRFGNRLQVERRAPAHLGAAQVPHLILQPLVENAIKYAVARTADPVRIEIVAERAGEELVLQVRDTGAPEAASRPPGLGVGLKNVEGRLRSLYGEAGRLVCSPLSPSGYLAEVRLPLVM
jgi:hypothetical protein